MTDAAGLSRILTLVFTDVADSTALKTQRGDQVVGELITRHRAHVRRAARAAPAARRLFVAIDADRHAERVARELAS